MKHYVVECNLTPEIADGEMKYYWQIKMITEDGIFTVKHGWAGDLYDAMMDAYEEADTLIENL